MIVASGQLPTTEQELADHAESETDTLNTAFVAVSEKVKEHLTSEDFDADSLDSVTFDSSFDVTLTLSNQAKKIRLFIPMMTTWSFLCLYVFFKN